MDPVNALAKFEVCTSPVLEITVMGVLVGGCEPSRGLDFLKQNRQAAINLLTTEP